MSLSSKVRPKWFSSEETGKHSINIDDTPSFLEFVSKNRFGFFLFGDSARYNLVSRQSESFCTISIDSITDSLKESDAVNIFETLAGNGLAFALAAHVDEYLHRNRYLRTIGLNHFEGWVGRDLSKYLPGVYWLTVVLTNNTSGLPGAAAYITDISNTIQIADGAWLIKAYENADEWAKYAEQIDSWCAEQPSVFSIRRIKQQLDTAENIGVLSRMVSYWK